MNVLRHILKVTKKCVKNIIVIIFGTFPIHRYANDTKSTRALHNYILMHTH